MKTKAMVLSCLVVVVLFMCYEYSSAKSQDKTVLDKIGVVNIRKVFRDCNKNAKYRADALSEQAEIEAEGQKLQKEFEAQRAGLVALKVGSNDYMVQAKDLMKKQAELEAMRQFNTQQRTIKDQQWTENLYQEVLQITRDLAEQKGLMMVFEKGEVTFPSVNSDELMLTLSTHKVLYSGGCIDISDDIIAKLDAEQK